MEQIGRYEVLEELGRGASGVVYRALDPAIGRTIAIKSIALDQIDESERQRIRERILREARSAGTLSHPSIVTIYDVLDSGESAYIFMEFVDGASLEELFKRGQLPSRTDLLRLLKQIAAALDYAHRKGIVHRDVKPANIVIAQRRTGTEPLAKVADFGVAKFVSQEATQHGAVMGTPNYMSPEQIQGTSVSGASDQFSLAVLTYEILTGVKPFVGENLPALFYQICKLEETPVNHLNPKLTPTISKVLQKAMSKEPEERFATCSEFVGALVFALNDCQGWTPIGVTSTAATTTGTGFVSDTSQPDRPAAASGPRAYPEEKSSWQSKLLLILALCAAVALTIVVIVKMNTPNIPTQILDTRNGPSAPPPPEDLKYDRSVPPLDLTPVAGAVNTGAGAGPPSKLIPLVKAAQKPVERPVPVPQPKPPTSASIDLLTDPAGATITVDGVTQCTTPVCTLTLSPGRHTLTAALGGFEVARKIFYVPADTQILIPMTRSLGVLLVSSEPSGSSVNVDGVSFGRTPLTLRLAPGPHRVSVWDGARWHDEMVQIQADEVHTRTFRF